MIIIKKDITQSEAESIQDIMLESFAWEVHIACIKQDSYIVLGTNEQKECYEDNLYIFKDKI